MKALSFIEMWNLNSKEMSEYNEFFKDLNKHKTISNIGFYANFLNQRFKPEMITEWFAGWETDLLLSHYKNQSDYVVFHIGIQEYNLIHNSRSNQFYIPRTLDDFITDCQRVGIELHWKVR